MFLRPLPLCAALLYSAAALAQSSGGTKGQYPECRSFSGLSGGGVAVSSTGSPDCTGALALSTPIGYTIDEGSAVVFGGTTSVGGGLRWFDGDVPADGSNGSAGLLFGVRLDQVRVGVSLVQTSRVSGDRIVNLQLSPTTCSGRVGFAAGVQDLLDQTVTTPDPHETTRSFFAASTYSVGDGVFVTLGAGTARFSKGFGNISALVVNGVRATLENDGFGWNYGAETDLPIKAEDARMSLFLGVVQSRYPTWSLSMRW